MTAFSAASWVRRLEAMGGHILRHDGKWLWGVPIDDNLDAVRDLSQEIAGPGRSAAVRQYVSGRP